MTRQKDELSHPLGSWSSKYGLRVRNPPALANPVPIATALRRVRQEDHFRRPSFSASLDNSIGNNFSPDFLPRGHLPEDALDRCARSPASELSGGEEFTVMKNLELLQQGFGNSGAKRPTAEGAMAGKHLPGSLPGSPYRPVRKNPGLRASSRGTKRDSGKSCPLLSAKTAGTVSHFRISEVGPSRIAQESD